MTQSRKLSLVVLGSAKALTHGGPTGPDIEPNLQPTRAVG